MGMNLMEAHDQWANRPADERFWSIEEMHQTCQKHRDTAREIDIRSIEVDQDDTGGNLVMLDDQGNRAKLTHWSFGQLCNRAKAPAEFLRQQPVWLATMNLNHGLKNAASDNDNGKAIRALYHQNGSMVCRAITSEIYTRIWNSDITSRMMDLAGMGWQVPPARPSGNNDTRSRVATEADCLAMSQKNISIAIKPGDLIAPAGLYASDHDMFAFMVNENVVIDDGTDGGMGRGFFITNSEVGACSLRLTMFMYKAVCGNHIVWDVKQCNEIRIRHVGGRARGFDREVVMELRKYAADSASREEGRILVAKRFELGANKDEVIDRLFNMRLLPRKTIEAAYEHAVTHEDWYKASPRSAWGVAQGLTWISQHGDNGQFMDKRSEIDRAAGKVIALAS